MHPQHPQQPQPVYIIQQETRSNTLPAVVNLVFPPFGQLVQGRVLAFFCWLAIIFMAIVFVAVVGLLTAGIGFLLGFLVGPVIYILCILDAVWYK